MIIISKLVFIETAFRSKILHAQNKACTAKMQVIWLTRSGVVLQTNKFRMNLDMLSKVWISWSRCGECPQFSRKHVFTLLPDWRTIASTWAEVPYSSSFPWIINCGTRILGRHSSMFQAEKSGWSQTSAHPWKAQSTFAPWCFCKRSRKFPYR